MFNELNFSTEQVHLMSDPHAYHKNISKGSSKWNSGYRDFKDENEMTQCIIDNVNKQVKKSDLLICNGDWSFGGFENVAKFRNQINCDNVYLMKGNHDKKIGYNNSNFQQITQEGYFKIGSIEFVTAHFPIANWYHKSEGTYMFHGHLHGMEDDVLQLLHSKYRIIDVGIDNAFNIFGEYRPFTLNELIFILADKTYGKFRER